jgi:hypothetical protein
MDQDQQDVAHAERIMAELRQMSPEQLQQLRRSAEQRLREIAHAHRGEVVPGSGEPVEPRDFG